MGRGSDSGEDEEMCLGATDLVAQIEFPELTDTDHLRHSKFAGLRYDKDPRQVRKEHAGN